MHIKEENLTALSADLSGQSLGVEIAWIQLRVDFLGRGIPLAAVESRRKRTGASSLVANEMS